MARSKAASRARQIYKAGAVAFASLVVRSGLALALMIFVAPAAASPVPIDLGETVSGFIDEGDEAVYSLHNLEPGQRVYVQRTSPQSWSLMWQLDDSYGRTIVSSLSNLTDLGPVSLMGGDYLLSIRASTETGSASYEFIVHDVVDSTGTLEMETPSHGSFASIEATHRLAFELDQPETVRFYFSGLPNPGLMRWRLVDELGNERQAWTTSAPAVTDPQRLPAGSYTLVLGSRAGYVGGWSVIARPEVITSSEIALGQPTPYSSDWASDVERFEFGVGENQPVVVQFLPDIGGPGGGAWRLERSDGVLIHDSPLNLNTPQNPLHLVPGNYVLTTHSRGAGEISGQMIVHAVPEPVEETVLFGGIIDGEIDVPGAVRHYHFNVPADRFLTIDRLATSNWGGLNYWLTDSAGRILIERTGFLPASSTRALMGGDYTLTVLGSFANTGSFEFELLDDGGSTYVPDGTPTLLDTLVSGTVDPQETNRYLIDLTDQTTLFFQLPTGTFPLRWSLYDQAGQALFANAFGTQRGYGPYPLLPGQYVLEFTTAANETNPLDYTFEARTPELTILPIEFSSEEISISGSIAGAGDRVEYDIEVPAERESLYFRMDSGVTMHHLRVWLYDPAGRPLFSNVIMSANTAPILAQPVTPGPYRMVIRGVEQNVGSYSFRLLDTPTESFLTAVGQSEEWSSITPGAVREYSFELTEPTNLFMHLTQTRNQVFATLTHEESGWTVINNLNLIDAHHWALGAHSLPPGHYRLSLRAAAAATANVAWTMVESVHQDLGEIELNRVILSQFPTPGSTLTYSFQPDKGGQALTVDIMNNAPNNRWILIDPVGTPVFDLVNAANPNQDRGPFPLASGSYSLTLNPHGHSTSEVMFRIAGAVEAIEIPEDCAACGALEVVFAFDTSGSMIGVQNAMCDLAGDLVDAMAGLGVPVTANYWSIATGGTHGYCLTHSVEVELGTEVPGNPPSEFSDLLDCAGYAAGEQENWGPVTAIIADGYPWQSEAVRLVVPVSDEGAHCGNPITELDTATVLFSRNIAIQNDVVVSPLIPESGGWSSAAIEPVVALGHLLAEGTGGFATHILDPTDPDFVLPQAVAMAAAACSTEVNVVAPEFADLSPMPGSVLPSGVPIVIGGRVIPVNALRPVIEVEVNGQPAQSLDTTGGFFATIELTPGSNLISISAVESCGPTLLEIELFGAGDESDPWSGMSDVSSRLSAVFSGTSMDLASDRLLVDVKVSNQGATLHGPILMAVGNDVDPAIVLLNADGTTPQGEPYVVVVPEGEILSGGELSAIRSLVFRNFDYRDIDFTPRWIAPVNRAPYFISIPPTRGHVDQLWQYRPVTVDADGDAVTHALLVAPPGMSFDGEWVTWTPTAPGNYDVVLRASDGRGGSARQTFSVQVGEGGFNSPPLFTTTPPIQAPVGAYYKYAAQAIDPDGDELVYTLNAGPDGMSVNTESGLVEWSGTRPGQHSVILSADDGNGGVASQSWVLYVGEPAQGSQGPAFLSTPITMAAVNTLYRYAWQLTYTQGVTVSLAEGPDGMTLASGVIEWTPGSDDVGTMPVVELLAIHASGQQASQRFHLHVVAELPNQPPFFTTTPALTGLAGQPWSYPARAIDPEFDDMVFSLVAGPAGMSVDGSKGDVTWVPDAGGHYPVSLLVTDVHGASASQDFVIEVRASNSPPLLAANPPATVYQGAMYGALFVASDPDDDPLHFEIVSGPAGMIIHSEIGWLSWNTQGVEPGSYSATVRVDDGWGGEDTWSFSVTVIIDDQPPVVAIGIDRQPACPGEAVTVCVQASDNVGVASRTLEIDGVPRDLNQNCSIVKPESFGTMALLATATDTSGLVAEATATLQVANCNDTNAPEVSLHSPEPGSTHNQPVPIVVSINDDTPAALTWTVELVRGSDGDPVLIGQGTGPVVKQAVAIFDPTVLAASDYRVRVIGSDGMQTGGIEFLINAGSGVKPGRVRFATQDVGLSLGGFPLSIGRSYDSLEAGMHAATGGDLGPGWHFSLNASVSDSARDVYGDDLPSMMMTQPYDFDTRVYVTRPDGARLGFSFDPIPAPFPALGQYDVNFKPDPGVTERLRAAEGPTRVFNWGSGFLDFIIPYNPALWELETSEGVVYLISETEGLLEIRDVLGGVITVGEDGIVSSWGPSIDFVRDDDGRVIEILLPPAEDGAPRGRIEYGYDASGNLVSVTDLGGGVSTFEYGDELHPHHLTALYDPLGQPIARMIFDEDGRMIAHCPADGDIGTLEGCSILDFDSGTNIQTVFDPRGYQTQRFFDDRGLIIAQWDWYDGDNYAEQTWTRDADGNLIKYTDAAGNETIRTFDESGQELSRTLPNGSHWQWTYGGCHGQWISFTDPQGNAWQREFNEDCELAGVIDPLGGRIDVSVDAGLPVQTTDAAAQSRHWNYNEQNLISASLDERGAATTYDYNDLGQLVRLTNRNDATVEFEYSESGRMTRAYWPATSREIELSYSALGQVTQVTGPEGTQQFEYWPTGQIKRVEHNVPEAPGWWVEYEYDLSGNVAKVTDSAGGITEYEYNGLNQIIAVQQTGAGVLDKRVEFDVNPAGLILEIRRYADLSATDAGPRTLFEYGCSSCITSLQAIRHLHADGTPLHEITMVRDERGRVVQRTDNTGVHEYLFDGRAWLIEDSDGVITWDGAGNWLNKPGHGDAMLSYGSDSGHLLLQDDLYQYSYDTAGLMTERTTLGSGERLILDHDPDQRLAGITRLTGGGAVLDHASYIHSPQGWRISAELNGIQRHYIHDGHNPMVSLDGDGTVVWRRMQTRVLDRPLAEERGGQIHWLLTDHIGSVREAVPHGGAPVSFSYDAWGRQLSGPLPSLDDSLRYSGRDFDLPAGLGYYRARTYLPDVGRFAEPDPQAPWHYAYAQNDPINLVDPTGEVSAIAYAQLACMGAETVSLLVTLLYAITDPNASNVSGFAVGGVGMISDYGGAAGGMGAGIGGAGADFFSQVMGLVVDGLNGKEVPPGEGLKLVKDLVKSMAINSFVPDKCGLRTVVDKSL
jgi:RHS repeat-associated protein